MALAVAACARAPAGGLALGGPFRLVDQSGRPQTEALLNGRWSAVYFGYTFCPDVCPTTMTALGAAQKALDARRRGFQVVFVSVDPERDSPGQIKEWLATPGFPSGAIGLTGAPAAVAQAERDYRVYVKKQGSGSAYAVDHSSVVYLMDPKGRFRAPIDASATPAAMATQIEKAMNG
jgi:protein SCO1/2